MEFNMNYGIQMYSVRDIPGPGLAESLKAVAEVGYKSIEFCGFRGHTAEEIVALLKEYDLKVSGTHSSFEALEEDFAGTVKYHQAIGNKNYIIPHAPVETAEELSETVKKFNKYQPMLAAEGINLGFHNHYIEFLPNDKGQIPHEVLQAETDIMFEIDTYWAFIAGLDPVALLEKLKARVPVIHLKDGNREKEGCNLGAGEAPVIAVRAKAIELGMDIVVESEGLKPTGIEEVARCMEFLKTLE